MLQIISLHTIQKIFENEATRKVGPMARLSYINTLVYYFDGKDATMENCKAFSVQRNEIKNPNVTMKYFEELERATLVNITDTRIEFPNKWYKYIDKSKLDRVTPEEYVGMLGARPAKEYEQELLTHGSAFDLLGMRHKLSREMITTLIKEFIMEQDAKNKSYYSASECASHCINWFNKRSGQFPKNNNKPNGKILGL